MHAAAGSVAGSVAAATASMLALAGLSGSRGRAGSRASPPAAASATPSPPAAELAVPDPDVLRGAPLAAAAAGAPMTVRVALLRARGLRSRTGVLRSRTPPLPYVLVEAELADGSRTPAARSPTRSSSDPVFNARVDIACGGGAPPPRMLHFRVVDHHRFGHEAEIGRVSYALGAADAAPSITFVKWLALRDAGDGANGASAAIQVQVTVLVGGGGGGGAAGPRRGLAPAAAAPLSARLGLMSLRIGSLDGWRPSAAVVRRLGASALAAGAYELRVVLQHGLRQYSTSRVPGLPAAAAIRRGVHASAELPPAAAAAAATAHAPLPLPFDQHCKIWVSAGEEAYLTQVTLLARTVRAGGRRGRAVIVGRGFAATAALLRDGDGGSAAVRHVFRVHLRACGSGAESAGLVTDTEESRMLAREAARLAAAASGKGAGAVLAAPAAAAACAAAEGSGDAEVVEEEEEEAGAAELGDFDAADGEDDDGSGFRASPGATDEEVLTAAFPPTSQHGGGAGAAAVPHAAAAVVEHISGLGDAASTAAAFSLGGGGSGGGGSAATAACLLSGDGTVGCLSLYGEYAPLPQLEQTFLSRLLAVFDTDGSGALDATELLAMLHMLGASATTADEVAALMARLDADGAGALSAAQISAWLRSSDQAALPLAASLLSFLADGQAGLDGLVNDVCAVDGGGAAGSGSSGAAGVASRMRSRGWAARLASSPAIAATAAGGGGGGGGSQTLASSDDSALIDMGVGGLRVFDRRTGLVMSEHVPVYVQTALKLMYASMGSVLVNTGVVRALLHKLSAEEGRRMDAPASRGKIAAFVAAYGVNLAECVIEDPAAYPCFNAFFARQLKPGARPIAAPLDDAVLVSPADARVVVYAGVSDATAVWVKGRSFTIESLLGPANADVAPLFLGGALAIVRLAPQDYHRWHLPATGRLGRRTAIDGALYTVNPIAIRRPSPDVFTQNKREVLLLHTRRFGLVALVAVGATVVGSIKIVLPDGSFQEKGACHGYFSYGGSTVVLLFQPNTIAFDDDLLRFSAAPLETFVRVGERLGAALHPARLHSHGLTDSDAEYARYAARVEAAAAEAEAGSSSPLPTATPSTPASPAAAAAP